MHDKEVKFLFDDSGFCRTVYRHVKTGQKVCWQVDGWYSFNEEPESLLSNKYDWFTPDKDAPIHCEDTDARVVEMGAGTIEDMGDIGTLKDLLSEMDVYLDGMTKLKKVIELVIGDNDLEPEGTLLPKGFPSAIIGAFAIMCAQIPEDLLEEFAIGEATKANKIAVTYHAEGLSNFLDELV